MENIDDILSKLDFMFQNLDKASSIGTEVVSALGQEEGMEALSKRLSGALSTLRVAYKSLTIVERALNKKSYS